MSSLPAVSPPFDGRRCRRRDKGVAASRSLLRPRCCDVFLAWGRQGQKGTPRSNLTQPRRMALLSLAARDVRAGEGAQRARGRPAAAAAAVGCRGPHLHSGAQCVAVVIVSSKLRHSREGQQNLPQTPLSLVVLAPRPWRRVSGPAPGMRPAPRASVSGTQGKRGPAKV